MSKRGKRLREFEKNNRSFNISEASQRRAERYSTGERRKQDKPVSDVTEETKNSGRKKKKIKIVNMRRFVGSVIVVILIACVGMSAINIIKLTHQRNELQERNAELIKIKEDLVAEAEYINSAEYIEQQARKELKLIKENELLFIISEEDKDN